MKPGMDFTKIIPLGNILFEVASRTRQQQPTFIYLTLNCLHFYDLTLEQMQLRTRAYFEDYFQKRVLLIVNKFKLDVNG